jgi:trigger factor
MPEILLSTYTGFKVSKEKFILNPENIEGEIKRMQENMAQLTPLDEGAVVENGHIVSIDYNFSVAGFPEESNSAQETELEVGAHKMPSDFEEQIIGMKCDETKEIRITLPADYPTKEAAGKEGVFVVTLNEIKHKELPALDDEFAQQFGEYETMDQLRAKMAEYLEKQESERIENELKEHVIQVLIEKNPLDVPKSMVKRQLDHMLENLKNRLKSQRMSIEMMGLDEEGFRQRFRDSAEDKVKGGLLLMALVEKEDISVSDEDLSERYELIAAGNPDMLMRIKEYYSTNKNAQHALISEIKEDKAIRFLLDNAVVTEIDSAALPAK